MNDFNEEIFKSWELLIASALSSLKTDLTELYLVTQDVGNGYYQVSNGSVSFQAYYGGPALEPNTSVRVLIPESDFSQDKMILGPAAPSENLTPIEKSARLVETSRTVYPLDSFNEESNNLSLQVRNYNSIMVYSEIKAKDQTKPYGLKFILTFESGVEKYLLLDSALHMIGNVSDSCGGYLPQSAKINTILSFNENDPIVGVRWEPYGEGLNTYWWYQNTKIIFGWDVATEENLPLLKVLSDKSLAFSAENNIRNLRAFWINRSEETGEIVQDLDVNKLKWYRWGDGQWIEVASGVDKLESISLNTKIITDKFKISYTLKEATEEEEAEEAIAMIAFNNLADPSTLIQDLSIFKIEHGLKSYPTYHNYQSDGLLVQAPIESGRQRQLILNFNSEFEEKGLNIIKGKELSWCIPIDNTMLKYDEKILTDTYGFSATSSNEGRVFSKTIPENISEDKLLDYLKFYYQISENYDERKDNNFITCKIQGYNFSPSVNFVFGISSQQGTGYTLAIIPENLQPFTDNNKNKNFTIKLTNPMGEEVLDKEFSCKIIYGPNQIEEKITLTDGVHFTLTFKDEYKYGMIQVSVRPEPSLKLTSEYLIYYAQETDYYAEAPKKILYDSRGALISDNQLLKLYKGEDLIDASWALKYAEASDTIVEGDIPEGLFGAPVLSQDEETSIWILKGAPTYPHGTELNLKIFLIATENGKEVWHQPILFEIDRWSMSVLNDWQGDLQIDSDGNYILSAMLGAGKKESDNSFTGVLMGEIGAAGGNVNDSGLFGYQKGMQTFKLGTNGTFKLNNENSYLELNEEGNFVLSIKNFDLKTDNLIINSTPPTQGSEHIYFQIGKEENENESGTSNLIRLMQDVNNNSSFVISAQNFQLQSNQMQISPAGIKFQSDDYYEEEIDTTETGTQTKIIYYYRLAQPTWGSGNIFIHSQSSKSVGYMSGNYGQVIRLECDSEGNLIKTTENGWGGTCYKVRNLVKKEGEVFKPSDDETDSIYFISTYYSNNDTFTNFSNVQNRTVTIEITTGEKKTVITGVKFDLDEKYIAMGDGVGNWIRISLANGLQSSKD